MPPSRPLDRTAWGLSLPGARGRGTVRASLGCCRVKSPAAHVVVPVGQPLGRQRQRDDTLSVVHAGGNPKPRPESDRLAGHIDQRRRVGVELEPQPSRGGGGRSGSLDSPAPAPFPVSMSLTCPDVSEVSTTSCGERVDANCQVTLGSTARRNRAATATAQPGAGTGLRSHCRTRFGASFCRSSGPGERARTPASHDARP